MSYTRRPWKRLMNVAAFLNHDVNPEMTFTERRDGVVATIKRLPQYKAEEEDQDDDGELWWIVDEMGDVQNEEEFDLVWDAFYDWADDERIWVETRAVNKTSLSR